MTVPYTWLDRSGRRRKPAKLHWIAAGIAVLFAALVDWLKGKSDVTIKVLVAAALLAVSVNTAFAWTSKITPDEIAALPQELVAAVKKRCAELHEKDFDTRLFCEDQEYAAIQKLIARGSIKPSGQK